MLLHSDGGLARCTNPERSRHVEPATTIGQEQDQAQPIQSGRPRLLLLQPLPVKPAR